MPAPRVADAFVAALICLELTAAGFVGFGGRGRVVEMLVAGAGCLLAYLLGWSRGKFAAVLTVVVFAVLEWRYGRFVHRDYWHEVLLCIGVGTSTLAAAYLRLGVESRAAQMQAAFVRLERTSAFDEIDAVLAERSTAAGSLDYELQRARRHNHQLSALIVRPDDFDEIALRFGDAAAQTLLRATAGAVGRCLRTTDIAIRRPPFDFVVVLPETPRADARMVGERIRLAVCEQRLEFGPGDVVDPSVSVGVASFPYDAASNEEMADVLGRALAAAVGSGGNRTILYSVPEGAPAGWGLSRARA